MALGLQQVGGGEAPGGGGIEVHGEDPLGGGGITGRLGLVTEDAIGDEDVVYAAEGGGKAGERGGRIGWGRKVGDGRLRIAHATEMLLGDGEDPFAGLVGGEAGAGAHGLTTYD